MKGVSLWLCVAGISFLANGFLLFFSSAVGGTPEWLLRYLPFVVATGALLALVFNQVTLAYLRSDDKTHYMVAVLILLDSISITGERPRFQVLNGIPILPPESCVLVGLLLMTVSLVASQTEDGSLMIPVGVLLVMAAPCFWFIGQTESPSQERWEGRPTRVQTAGPRDSMKVRRRGRPTTAESALYHDVQIVSKGSGGNAAPKVVRTRVAFRPLDSDVAVSDPIERDGKRYLALGLRSSKDSTNRELDGVVLLDLSASWKNPYR